jgi:hypothetical protein
MKFPRVTAMGLMRVSANKWCQLAKQFHTQLDGDEHIMIPQSIVINGDAASCHVLMHASHFYRKANGSPYQSLVGTYDLDLVRTNGGWKIIKSVQASVGQRETGNFTMTSKTRLEIRT